MKKSLSLAVLFAGISLTTFAQEKGDARRPITKDLKPSMEEKIARRSPEDMAKLKTERLDKKLKFTDAQRTKIYAVQLEQAKNTVVHRGEMRELQSKWREEMKGTHQKVKEILTPQQQEQLKESYAQRRKGKGSKGEFRKRRMLQNQVSDTENTEG